jgi:hypothetical protein
MYRTVNRLIRRMLDRRDISTIDDSTMMNILSIRSRLILILNIHQFFLEYLKIFLQK